MRWGNMWQCEARLLYEANRRALRTKDMVTFFFSSLYHHRSSEFLAVKQNLSQLSVDRLSTAMSTDCRPSINRVSTGYRPSVDRLSTECQPTIYRVSTAISTAMSTDISVDITHSKQDPKWLQCFSNFSSLNTV